MPNMKNTIDAHNKSVISTQIKPPPKQCNCRVKEQCPLNGKCQHHDKGVVYRATATTQEGGVKTYTGSTDNFKNRWYAHVGDTQDRDRRTATALAGFFWEKKDEGVDTGVRWEILRVETDSRRTFISWKPGLRIGFFHSMFRSAVLSTWETPTIVRSTKWEKTT